MSAAATKPGEHAAQILREVVEQGTFTSSDGGTRRACIRMNAKGLLRRDKKDADLWYPSQKLLDSTGTAKVVAVIPQSARGKGDLAEMSALALRIERARVAFDAGDVDLAQFLSSASYEESKAAVSFGRRVKAKRELQEKARSLEADALYIWTQCDMHFAEQWEKAVDEGRVLKGRPKSVPDENAFTAEEIGLSRKEIHEARKILAAERREPGIVKRALEARLAAGLEPTRANLRAAVGTASATKEERGQNLYETPPEAMHTLLALETFTVTVLEPACGRGAIARMLELADYGVILADLVDYETADQNGELQVVQDFLTSEPPESGSYDIVTNPPYGDILNAFVAHALRVYRPRKMALLLNLNFLCGFADDDRNFVMDDCPPARVYVFKRRLPMMHRDGWEGNKASSRMNTAWFVWELQEDGTYGTQTITKRVDWCDFMPAAADVADAESEAA
ncbi:SAM-dependent methyltransferase [Agrobacterium rhizogenes]|nr:SAM-dependent methyltransferase [Rhizobium rhizogenes]